MKAQSTLAILLVLGTFASCNQDTSKSTTSKNHQISIGSIVADKSIAPKEKAERLALAGEQLITLTGFMYAEDIIDQALALDPQNKRALFYKSLIAAPMKLKGILTRIKPLVKANPESQKSYNEFVDNLMEGSLKTFLLSGSENIRTEKDVQAFLDEIYRAQDQFRNFLKNNKKSNLVLNLNDVGLLKQSIKETLETCLVEQVGSGTFNIKDCDMSKVMQLELNRADFESLQHITAGMQIYTLLYNSYDISGSLKVVKDIQEEGLSSSEVWEKLTQNTEFGKVRNPKFLQSIPALGTDVVSGLRWAMSMQDELCPSGQNERGNRKGFLFSKGVCIPSGTEDGSYEDVLKIVDVVLAGQTKMFRFATPEGKIETEVKATSILTNPIKDLKALKPSFNECGKITKLADSSLGGLFTNRDANKIIEANSKCEVYEEESDEFESDEE